jgi:hypothetical protein
MIEFARTDLDGSFKFRRVENGKHLVKITYLGFIPITVDASSLNGENLNLGRLEMVEIAEELMEVVIRAAKAPMKIRGDTIEYDATTFKVPPGSTVEDLLKRLPGMEVDPDGTLMSEGKEISQVTVDGKKFFGTDPKAATKNLPAEGISKVQVFDRKTEEEEITGATAEAETKTMNLELKDDFKKGGFGKVTGGIGTATRAEIKGNYNKFNEKIQMSVIGVGNNTGRNGLSWDDYQDFMGSNSFNFNDGGDYGFGGGKGRHFINFGGGDESGIESSIQSVFFNGRNNGGFPENYNGGGSFNYDHNKNKFNSVYYYNQTGLNRETKRRSENYFSDFTSQSDGTDFNDNLSAGHRGEFVYEKEIDSLHTIKFSANLAAIGKNNQSYGNTLLSRNGIATTSSAYDNILKSNGYLLNGQFLLRKKFQKKGRSMGLNVSYLNTSLDDEGTLNSTNTFLGANEIMDSVSIIDQINNSLATKNQFKANAIFVEPLSKRFFFQTFFNHSTRIEDGDRDVFDITPEGEKINGFLSRVFENQITLNRLGAQLRYSYKGVNLSVGSAFQHFNLTGLYDGKGAENINGIIDRKYSKWIPHASLNMAPVKNSYLSLSYNVRAQEPSIGNLQPIVDNRNPLFIREGNPNLVPSISHNASLYFSLSKPATSLRFSVNGSYDYNVDEIIMDQTVDENLVTYSKPINYTGGQNVSFYSNVSVPLLRNKITARFNFSSNIRKSFAFVNTLLNETNSIGYRPGLRLNFTFSEDLSLYANANYNIINTKFNISTSQNQRTVNSSYGVEFNAKTILGLYLNSKFSYNQYSNERFGFNQSVPLLNVSLYKRFLKDNKAELRLSMYDGLNQNLSVSQYASSYGINTSETFAIGRYVMMSFTYNLRGLKTDVRKGGRWH